jgi:hypothetical protein
MKPKFVAGYRATIQATEALLTEMEAQGVTTLDLSRSIGVSTRRLEAALTTQRGMSFWLAGMIAEALGKTLKVSLESRA